MGFDNIKVIGPEKMPILVWGRRKRPPTKLVAVVPVPVVVVTVGVIEDILDS